MRDRPMLLSMIGRLCEVRYTESDEQLSGGVVVTEMHIDEVMHLSVSMKWTNEPPNSHAKHPNRGRHVRSSTNANRSPLILWPR